MGTNLVWIIVGSLLVWFQWSSNYKLLCFFNLPHKCKSTWLFFYKLAEYIFESKSFVTAGIVPTNDWLNLELINGREAQTRSVLNAVKVKEGSTWMKIAVPSMWRKAEFPWKGLMVRWLSINLYARYMPNCGPIFPFSKMNGVKCLSW